MVTKPKSTTPAHLTNARPQDEIPTGVSGPKSCASLQGILNERQEKYAHFRAMGKTQADAALLAGYSGHGANASRLDHIPAIKSKIDELRSIYQSQSAIKIETAKAEVERLIEKEQMGLSYFVGEFRANLEMARNEGDIRAANECLRNMAQMLGFMKSRDDQPDGSKKNDQPRTQIGIKIENNSPSQMGGPPGILIEDPDAVADVTVEQPD